MSKGKTSFVLYHDIRRPLELLDDEQRGKLFMAILDYSELGKVPQFEGDAALIMAFTFIRGTLDRDAETWEAKRQKRVDAGRIGGQQTAANRANATFATQKQQTVANQAVPVPVPVPAPVPVPVPVPGDVTTSKSKEKSTTYSCAEPEKSDSTPPVITLPLNDGSEYPILQRQCHEWADLYPAVDVLQQLRNMRGWLDANPTRRKTRNGIKRFITGWLSKEQNRAGPNAAWARSAGGADDGEVVV